MATQAGRASRARPSFETDGSYVAFNPWRDFCAQLPDYIDSAHRVRHDAFEQHKPGRRNPSHRGYYVGGTIVAFSHADGETSLVTYSATNSKPTPTSDGVCSELRVVTRVEKLNKRQDEPNYESIGLVVIGDPQPDQATGFEASTLWMCSERCWPNIIEPGRIARDALIVTVRPDKRRAQVQTAEELDDFYSRLREGEAVREPNLVDHLAEDWKTVVDRFDEIIPRDLDPFASHEARTQCVEAARTAIQQRPQLSVI